MPDPVPLREESDVQRVKRMQLECATIGLMASRQWLKDLERLTVRAAAIVEMGDAVPVGVRELLERTGVQLGSTGQTLAQILGRTRT